MKDIVITLPFELWQKIVKKEKRIELRKGLPRLFDNSRSKCYVFPELAKAIARQWTDYILSDDAPLGSFRTTTDNENKPSK